MGIIEDITKDMIRNDIPDFWVGDTVRVHKKIKEGNKERVQIFEGVVIGRKGGGISESFCVRKVSDGISIEKVFPLNSPAIAKIEVASRGKVRRAKLYYLRTAKGKKAKIERRLVFKKASKKEE